ncbi:NERD domain-containing protein [Oscillospiraceae bacterium LTW-04]|nr:NERD domain-containing protein [Oscillospiraceae bacterium MB24-C1]
MFFENFQAWKLHTWQDYTYFFLMAFSCFALLYFVTKAITKRRNDASALKRVKKKLKVKDGKVYHDVTFDFAGQQIHFDHLLVDAAGMVAVRSIGWGIRVYGSSEDETWKVEDNKTKNVRIENPIRVLQQCFEPMRKGLSQGGIYGVSIDALTIFADPFALPELYLGRDSGCIVLEQLGSWVKNRKMRANGKVDKLDVNAVTDYLDKVVVPPQIEQ